MKRTVTDNPRTWPWTVSLFILGGLIAIAAGRVINAWVHVL